MSKLEHGHNLPPLPLSYELNQKKGNPDGVGFVYILDANGRKVASIWGRPAEKIALAELICHASDRVKVTP